MCVFFFFGGCGLGAGGWKNIQDDANKLTCDTIRIKMGKANMDSNVKQFPV